MQFLNSFQSKVDPSKMSRVVSKNHPILQNEIALSLTLVLKDSVISGSFCSLHPQKCSGLSLELLIRRLPSHPHSFRKYDGLYRHFSDQAFWIGILETAR